MISLNQDDLDVDQAIATEDDRLQITRPPSAALVRKMQAFYSARPEVALRLYWWPKDVAPTFLRELPMLRVLSLDQYGDDERLPALDDVTGKLTSLAVTSRGAVDLLPAATAC